MSYREQFRSVLRRTVETAVDWPKKPDKSLKVDDPGHGWLLPVLLEVEGHCWGRWDHWFRTMEAGQVLNLPIPQIEFCEGGAGLARKMHEKSLDSIGGYGGWQGWDSWRLFDYYLDWLLYGFGDQRQKEPPPEPSDGAFSRLWQVCCLEAMIAWPADLFGDLMAENRHGRGAGFFPTPESVVGMMVRMLMGDLPPLRAGHQPDGRQGLPGERLLLRPLARQAVPVSR